MEEPAKRQLVIRNERGHISHAGNRQDSSPAYGKTPELFKGEDGNALRIPPWQKKETRITRDVVKSPGNSSSAASKCLSINVISTQRANLFL